MRTVEHVKLNSDSNYIPSRWVVMEVTVGTTLASSQAWVKCVSYGCDTEANLLAFKLTSDGYQSTLGADGRPQKQTVYAPVDKSGIVGTIGTYQVVALDAVAPYDRPKIDFVPNIEIG